ncbi:MAG: hypothetical protein HYU36_14150 [Planctomycetes bacterium]|nr:hypothetical protein [Planctomycetota bacterium]
MAARVPLAWRNLTFNKRRLLVSMAGVMFAVILMFMELGYKNALFDSSYEMIRLLDADLFLISSAMDRTASNAEFPRRRLFQALENTEVASAVPLYMTLAGEWRNPEDGKRAGIRVIGIPADESVFLIPEIRTQQHLLRQPDTVLMDTQSRRFKYGRAEAGVLSELAGRTVQVAGVFSLGPTFAVDGTLVTSDHNFLRFFPGPQDPQPKLKSASMGLLRVRPGADLKSVQEALRGYLPGDVQVLTKPEMIAFEKDYWLKQSTIAPVFNMGAFVGFVVGMVICYQILFTDLSDQLPQFATLKAIGHSNRYLFQVVVTHSLFLSLVSFFPAVGCSYLLYEFLSGVTGLLMRMSVALILMMLVLTVAMCTAAGSIAVRKVLSVDPADLFR